MSETKVNVDSLPNSVVQPEVVVGALNATDIKSGLTSIAKLGDSIALLLHNDTLTKVTATFDVLAGQDWFVSLIVNASALFDKGQPGQALELLKSSLPPAVIAACNGPVVAGALNTDEVTKGLDALLKVATIVSSLSGNPAAIKAVAVLDTVAREAWFVSIVVNVSHLFGV